MANHVSNFAQPGLKIVLDMINDDNGTHFTDATVSVAQSVTPPTTKNSAITVTALPGSGYTGSDELEYNRLDIAAYADIYFEDGLKIQLGDAGSVIDLLDEINTALGTGLAEGVDIADQEIPAWEGIPNEVKVIDVAVLATSLVYTGTLQFSVDANDIPLSSVITTKVLSGLNLPAAPAE